MPFRKWFFANFMELGWKRNKSLLIPKAFLFKGIVLWYTIYRGIPADSAVKNPPVMQKAWVQSLGREDPLEEGIATHSSILAWRIPPTEEPGGLQSIELQRVRPDSSDWPHIEKEKVSGDLIQYPVNTNI